MERLIYLDHAATTPLEPEAREAMASWMGEAFASASTLYTAGRRAAQAVEAARADVARLIGAAPEDVFFTGGGSEANNWAIFGAAAARGKKGHYGGGRSRDVARVAASVIEHHSVLEPCRELGRRGYDVTWAGVDEEGVVELERLDAALGAGSALLCLMHANNEIGTIQPVEAAGRLARERGIHYHVDAVQTAGHVAVRVDEIGCDTLALAAHKLGGPKGVGALYIRKGVKIENLIFGGGQEAGRRAGTQNVAGIVGFGRAAALARERLDAECARLAGLRDELIKGIEERIEGAVLNGHRTRRLPGNVNFAFDGIESGELIMRLDLAGIYASAGSACTSGALAPSHVLLALGRGPELAHGSLRLTLGRGNGKEDVARVLAVLPEIVGRLRD